MHKKSGQTTSATAKVLAAACCSDDASRRRSRFHEPAFAVTTVRNCEATATGLHAAASIQLTNGPQGCGRIARKSDGIWHATGLTKHSFVEQCPSLLQITRVEALREP